MAQYWFDNLTKPLGSLGKLEMLAVRTCTMRRTIAAKVEKKIILTFAGDHGALATVGWLEIAAICGCILEAAGVDELVH